MRNFEKDRGEKRKRKKKEKNCYINEFLFFLFPLIGYDIRTKKKFDETFAEFENIVGFKYLKALHLNDSKSDLGSKLDRHESMLLFLLLFCCFCCCLLFLVVCYCYYAFIPSSPPGLGIGKIGGGVFEWLMGDKRFKGMPMILETPDSDKWKEEISLLYGYLGEEGKGKEKEEVE